eukprot:IDg15900t1
MPTYASGLPGAFAPPSGAAPPPPALLPQPAQPAGATSKFGARTLPAPQTQAPSRLLGIPALPAAAPGGVPLHALGGGAPSLSALAGTQGPRVAPPKMHTMGMMAPQGATQPNDVMSLGHALKKEVGRASVSNTLMGAPPGSQQQNAFGPPGRQTVIPTQAPVFHQAQQEDDYVVYQGRTNHSSSMNMNMKV